MFAFGDIRWLIVRAVLCGLLAGVCLFGQSQQFLLLANVPSPAALGTPITWSVSVAEQSSATFWYRFRARPVGGDFHTLVDFGPNSALTWTQADREGTYEVEASVKDPATGQLEQTTAQFVFTPLAFNVPVITPTQNPLVYLYSAPDCSRAGFAMKVQFESANGYLQSTPAKPCVPGQTMNFYIAGLRPQTTYRVQHLIDLHRHFATGPALNITTPAVALPQTSYSVLTAPSQPSQQGILLQSPIFSGTVATDLYGNLLWYYSGKITVLTRAEKGGYFLGIFEDGTSDPLHQYVRKFDLAGFTLAETNAARISEQLTARGLQPISGFHHEARTLPDGNIMVLAGTERLLTDVQGPGTVDVLGDMILVLDPNLQVLWTWDAFDHLDPYRMAVLGEICNPVGSGCAAYFLAPHANDWLHGNSLQLTPDGNILYSSRHQDWLVKIQYQNGAGDGSVLWRLGKDGDFQFISSDPWPWFSHQHDANFEVGDSTKLDVFDDGNTRHLFNPDANSRGQVLQLDEQSRTATLLLNTDLGRYSDALGSAYRLPDGNYHFDVGWIFDPSGGAGLAQSVELSPSGSVLYTLQMNTPEYRTFRMADLYTP